MACSHTVVEQVNIEVNESRPYKFYTGLDKRYRKPGEARSLVNR